MFTAELKSEWNEDISILIKVDNHSYNYICECGEASGLSVKDCQNTNAIFISHTHIDHFANFDTVLRHQLGIGRKVVICGPEGIIEQVHHRLKSYCWNLIAADALSYEVREVLSSEHYRSAILRPPAWEILDLGTFRSDRIFEEKDFHVEFEILDHKTDSIAYLFRANDKVKIDLPLGTPSGKWVGELKAAYEMNEPSRQIKMGDNEYPASELFHMMKSEQGKTLGVIMDHAASVENHRKIEAKFKNCDEIFIECFYKDEDKDLAIKNHHSYASKSGEIVKKCHVGSATPVHFSRKYNAEEVAQLHQEFDKARKG